MHRIATQKALDFGERPGWSLLGNEVAAVERAPGDVLGDFAPIGQAAELRLDHGVLAPKDENRHCEQFPPVAMVMLEIDRAGSTKVFTRGVDRTRIAEAAADVFAASFENLRK